VPDSDAARPRSRRHSQVFIPSSLAKVRQVKSLVGGRPIEISVEVGEALTLLNSDPASEVGSRMDPARFPHAPHLLAPDSQTTCGKTQ